MALLEIAGLCKGFDHVVLDQLDLNIEQGEFFVVVGPSGIGKTTLLRLIAGLEHPDQGSIRINGAETSHLPPYKRNVALTFESYALYPHLTVYENIASPLRARRETKSSIDQKVRDVAKLLRIDQLLDRKPGEVSGGQKQRTALGRTLVRAPDVFLLDEPISHLDAKIRHELRLQFHQLAELRRTATLYVTHDYAEALSLGDRIGVMGDGGLKQIGSPREVFTQPHTLFVARHLGQPSINEIQVTIMDGGDGLFVAMPGGSVALPVAAEHRAALRAHNERTVTLGLRPQYIEVKQGDGQVQAGRLGVDAQVDLFEALGAYGVLIAEFASQKVTALTGLDVEFAPQTPVHLLLDPASFLYFDQQSGRNLAVRGT